MDTQQVVRLLQTIQAPFLQVSTSNLGGGPATVFLLVSLQRQDEWTNGIMENSPACRWSFRPSPRGDEGRVVVEQFVRYAHRMPKFRKRTVHVSKLLGEVQDYIDGALAMGDQGLPGWAEGGAGPNGTPFFSI